MDITMQQAENSESTANGNNNNVAQVISNGDSGVKVAAEEVENIPTYDQQFPSLGGGTMSATTAPPIGRWNKKPPLQSSTITQVFHIPPEERKAYVEGFGGGESLKKLDAIMNNTQTKIEMSSAKEWIAKFV